LQAKRSEHISRFKTVLTKLLTSKINKNKRAHGAAHPASLSIQILQQTLDRHFPASFLKHTIYPSAKPTDWVPTRVPIAFQHRWNALATDPNMMALLQSDPDGTLFSNTVKNKIATLVLEAHHTVWNHYWNLQKTKDEANTPSSPSATQQMTQPTPGPSTTQATQATQTAYANTTTGGETIQATAPEDRKRRRICTSKQHKRKAAPNHPPNPPNDVPPGQASNKRRRSASASTTAERTKRKTPPTTTIIVSERDKRSTRTSTYSIQ
jgi:hypothetical protein